MGNTERRKYPRVQIFDPISYLSLDSDSEIIHQNVAVVRDVSQTGIQMEAFLEVKSKKLSLMFFDMHKNQIEVKGKVVYCRKNESGQFSIGIQFIGNEAENLRFVKALVKSYHYQKEKSRLAISPGIQN
ncbi:MAG: PilZ domain-containing protein [Desulfobacterales bacterium]